VSFVLDRPIFSVLSKGTQFFSVVYFFVPVEIFVVFVSNYDYLLVFSTPRSSGRLNSPFFENLVSMSEVKSKFEYAYLNYLYVYENENFLHGSGGLGLIEFWTMEILCKNLHIDFCRG